MTLITGLLVLGPGGPHHHDLAGGQGGPPADGPQPAPQWKKQTLMGLSVLGESAALTR